MIHLTDIPAKRAERIHIIEETDSTNRLLLQMAKEGAPDRTVVIADSQSAGRGRLGRTFASPKGMGVYLSYLIKPDVDTGRDTGDRPLCINTLHSGTVPCVAPAAWTAITSCTAVAVSDAIERTAGIRPDIKWVNDLYIEGKKICGILTQMDPDPTTGLVSSIVIGIGVNILEETGDFPEEIRDIAGSLKTVTGREISRDTLATEMIRALDRMHDDWQQEAAYYLQAYRASSILPGREITVHSAGTERKATALSIGDDFSLLVRYADGTVTSLTGGEVSVRFP